ncbi:hypothetical protein [Pallidibacillus pasinlerensis]|uniref:Uncharacterized protein n=1 Tax=Pallidibacillus pasinlerensis TaxID=2703818 RepID=A0ABX0AAR7_9BACI|nr:hypothetical protein [Pallidibacillus pasinlerensis]NCU18520.1 hypothetical protein [Pallidibacillus pasinlerensis]
MEFQWYEVIDSSQATDISQGDIISCLVPVTHSSDEFPFFEVSYGNINGIVMTQACDLENGKVEEITLCPLVPLEDILKDYILEQYKNTEGFNYESLTKKQQNNKYKYAEKIRQGNILDYYLLNRALIDNNPELNMDFQVVLLRKTFRIPITSLKNQINQNPSSRLRLLPPYREHLSYAYSFNFSRIGLPIDINIPEDI